MVKMKIAQDRLEKFQTLDELAKEIFTDKQIKEMNAAALKRSTLRNQKVLRKQQMKTEQNKK